MKNLITNHLGGHPVYFKDFEFVQEMIRELAKTALGHLDSSIVTILNGCDFDVSGDGYTIDCGTEGWAWYNGEFFYIPIHQATGSPPNVAKWRIVESWDSRGLKTFNDPAVGDVDVFQVRQLRLGFYPVVSEGVLFSDSVLPERQTDWTQLSAQSPWGNNIVYRKNLFGHLEIVGQVDNGSAGHNSVIAVFPEDFRPDSMQRQSVSVQQRYGCGTIQLSTNGELRYYSQDYPTPLTAFLNHTFILKT